MKNHITIKNKISPFNKTIEVDSDKSISIRCVLLASQAIGKSRIYNLLDSEDVLNTLKSINSLGIRSIKKKNYHEIFGYGLTGFNYKKTIKINAGNSGTLARLILGLLINSNNKIRIVGDRSLSMRDFSRITEPLKEFGANFKSNNNKLPVEIFGSEYLRPINYLEKIGSAQCKSAVMLAALKTPGVTRIKAKKSRDHTELLLKSLNIPIKISKTSDYDLIEIKGQNSYTGFNYHVPGDISSSSFFLVLTILGENSSLTIRKVNINKTRIGILNILKKMNANINIKNKKKYKGELIGDIICKSRNNLKAIRCPKKFNTYAIDEFLIIFLVAAKAKGVSTFRDLGELNKKESPRLDIGIKFLKMIGIKVVRNKDDLKIYGNPNIDLKGKFYMKNFRKDHRVFMMSCIAALTIGGDWKIYDSNSVNTSFPNFLKKIRNLGAKIS